MLRLFLPFALFSSPFQNPSPLGSSEGPQSSGGLRMRTGSRSSGIGGRLGALCTLPATFFYVPKFLKHGRFPKYFLHHISLVTKSTSGDVSTNLAICNKLKKGGTGIWEGDL